MTSLKVQASPGRDVSSSVATAGAAGAAGSGCRSRIKNPRDHKTRILKQTLVIVLTFLVCWTPYALAALWYHIDAASYLKLDPTISSILFLFAVSNSIINPFIYGKFVKDNPQRV